MSGRRFCSGSLIVGMNCALGRSCWHGLWSLEGMAFSPTLAPLVRGVLLKSFLWGHTFVWPRHYLWTFLTLRISPLPPRDCLPHRYVDNPSGHYAPVVTTWKDPKADVSPAIIPLWHLFDCLLIFLSNNGVHVVQDSKKCWVLRLFSLQREGFEV